MSSAMSAKSSKAAAMGFGEVTCPSFAHSFQVMRSRSPPIFFARSPYVRCLFCDVAVCFAAEASCSMAAVQAVIACFAHSARSSSASSPVMWSRTSMRSATDSSAPAARASGEMRFWRAVSATARTVVANDLRTSNSWASTGLS